MAGKLVSCHVLGTQAWSTEFGPQHHVKSWVGWHIPRILVLGRHRWVHLWDSLTRSQSNQETSAQRLKRQSEWLLRNDGMGWPLTYIHTHIQTHIHLRLCTHMHIWTCIYINTQEKISTGSTLSTRLYPQILATIFMSSLPLPWNLIQDTTLA